MPRTASTSRALSPKLTPLRTTSRLAARRLARKVLAATRDEAPPARQARTRKRGPSTVAEGWDRYARRRRTEPRIGDNWNNPRITGLDVEDGADVVGYLDRVVFEPFLGEPDVIVEIGPGGGRFTEVLLPKCRVLHAVDTSSHMIDALRARFREDRSVVYHVADGTGLGKLFGRVRGRGVLLRRFRAPPALGHLQLPD